MKRPFLWAAVLCVLLLSGCHNGAPTRIYTSPAGPNPPPKFPYSEPYMELEAFDSAVINVLAADVNLVTGEDWSVSYAVSECEPLAEIGVVDGTLHIETEFDEDDWLERRSDWFITVTVPADAAFSEITVDAVTGNIGIDTVSCDSMVLFSNSGSITGQGITAEALEANAFGESVKITDANIGAADIDSISGCLEVSGSFGELRTNTVGGITTVSADISVCGELDGASGAIRLDLRRPSAIDAFCSGKLTINNTVMDAPVTCGQGVPVSVQALSGNIEIFAPIN